MSKINEEMDTKTLHVGLYDPLILEIVENL